MQIVRKTGEYRWFLGLVSFYIIKTAYAFATVSVGNFVRWILYLTLELINKKRFIILKLFHPNTGKIYQTRNFINSKKKTSLNLQKKLKDLGSTFRDIIMNLFKSLKHSKNQKTQKIPVNLKKKNLIICLSRSVWYYITLCVFKT